MRLMGTMERVKFSASAEYRAGVDRRAITVR